VGGGGGREIWGFMGCAFTLSFASHDIAVGESQQWQHYHPIKSPGEVWELKGKGGPETGEGNWIKGLERLFTDLGHTSPIGPHWDWKDENGNKWRIYPHGRIEPK